MSGTLFWTGSKLPIHYPKFTASPSSLIHQTVPYSHTKVGCKSWSHVTVFVGYRCEPSATSSEFSELISVDVTENSFAERLRLNGEGPTLEHGVGAAGECAEGILKYVHEGLTSTTT